MGHFMRIFLYILAILVSLAVMILPWVLIQPITFVTVLISVAGLAALVLSICGLVLGWGISLRVGGST
jgi:prepilin signal peptidase PulO-like enzyme (type II secretory pathway)